MHSHGSAGLAHTALLYASDEALVERLVPEFGRALADGVAVLACFSRERNELLAATLGNDASRVTFLDREPEASRPASTIDALARFAAQAASAGSPSVAAFGELPVETDELLGEWFRYEAAVNEVFAGTPLTATCCYSEHLPEPVLEAVARTHPLVSLPGGLIASPAFAGSGCDTGIAVPPLAPPRPPDLLVSDVAEARQARAAAAELLDRAGPRLGLDGLRDDLTLVVSELATNAILHGGTPASIAFWVDQGSVTVQVCDDGPGIDDPYAGLRPPEFPMRGAGLWVAHLLADRVTIDRSPAGGAAVTVRLRV